MKLSQAITKGMFYSANAIKIQTSGVAPTTEIIVRKRKDEEGNYNFPFTFEDFEKVNCSVVQISNLGLVGYNLIISIDSEYPSDIPLLTEEHKVNKALTHYAFEDAGYARAIKVARKNLRVATGISMETRKYINAKESKIPNNKYTSYLGFSTIKRAFDEFEGSLVNEIRSIAFVPCYDTIGATIYLREGNMENTMEKLLKVGTK